MDALIPSLLPIFLIMVLGGVLKRYLLPGEEAWVGMERIGYFLLYPILLARTLYRTDFEAISAASAALAFIAAIAGLLALMIAVRPLLQPRLGLSSPSYSSFYQATTRWNAFVILAIAEQIGGPQWLAIVAIGIGTMIVPINVVNIVVMTHLCRKEGPSPSFFAQLIRNPLIIGVAAGLAINGLGLAMPAALDTTLELLARIALPLGLLLVGAGLRIRMPGKDVVAVFAASFVKLLVMPLFLGVAAWATGMRGADLSAVVLCGAGPSAMNAYLLAKQMGGDAPLFAAMVTAQTVLSFVTIPLVMALAQWMAG